MYARIVTSTVLPGKLNALTCLYEERLQPMLERQPGFKEIFVLVNPQTNKEISITFWQSKADMAAFDAHLATLSRDVAPLLAAAPEVEIFEVSLPMAARSIHEVPFSELSLGLRIEESFDWDQAEPYA